mmetsp:Transcript_18466/g.30745  ORF Transcript_18466/g.30745 Transcript_18466/m.30745 type:complete len:206 (+) Transcript_18466:134-751(+)
MGETSRSVLVAPCALEVTFRFHIGKKLVELEMRFDAGDDAAELVRAFMANEDIPKYMERSMLSSLDALFDEESKHLRQAYESAVVSPQICYHGAREWSRLFRRRNVTYSDWAQREPNREDLLFGAAFHFLLAAKSDTTQASTLAEARQGMLDLMATHMSTISEAIEKREVALADLLKTQAAERAQFIGSSERLLFKPIKLRPWRW